MDIEFTFRDWVAYKLEDVPVSERNAFAKDWLVAVDESFARKKVIYSSYR